MKVMMMSTFWIILISMITLFSCLPSVTSQLPYDIYPIANLSALWINDDSSFTADRLWRGSADNSTVRIILRTTSSLGPDPEFGCGFYSDGTRDSYLFAVFILNSDSDGIIYSFATPVVVWSANRNNPVGINSTLDLTGEGDLVLRDGDGSLAWSTNTVGRSVVRLNMTEMGNLVLLDANSSVVWQSFDHPTDCLLPGQELKASMNLTENKGMFSVLLTEKGLVASIQSDPPQVYFSNLNPGAVLYKGFFFNRILNKDIYFPILGGDRLFFYNWNTSAAYMKLGTDGHLRVFEWLALAWNEVADLFTDFGYLSECEYPLVCGKYGICTNGQCSCPNGTSFRPIKDRLLNQVCSEVVPLTCNASVNHYLLDLDNVRYFALTTDIVETDINGCKDACLKNCSCKAAIFYNYSCYMPSQLFSMWENDSVDNSAYSVSIKFQSAPIIRPLSVGTTRTVFWPILGSTLGVLFVVVVIGVFVYRRRRGRSEEVEEDCLDHVPGMPTRFSFEELAIATDNFNKKLGEGGFGSVFEGSFNDGTRIAVKSLDGGHHIKKSFLAEVQSMGSIHHISLVRLIGFCAEKSHRLLVYEHMCNGSLERWIYCRSNEKTLEWNCRRKIILDIAKGLAYLHEDCLQKIIHLDIKPQNILLDEHYNAKLGDFGLSKLIDRNQSKVVTTMRGTPGYLAPEWLKSGITEKVDVYSFGVVILEIVCGRKIFEQSRPEEERHLPTLFMKKAEEGQFLDLVDKCCQDVDSNVAEIEEMMQISALCLQSDPEKRPSMSMVIKILEGASNVQTVIDYNFLRSQIPEVSCKDATTLLPSLLSGPR